MDGPSSGRTGQEPRSGLRRQQGGLHLAWDEEKFFVPSRKSAVKFSNMRGRSTMGDVAKLANVSKSTVSTVLSGRIEQARISPSTAERVLRAAKELNYTPNAVARMLNSQRSDSIAVVFQYAELFSSKSSFINELMQGVCSAAVEEGLDLMLHTRVVGNPQDEANTLADGRVDGVLILRDRDDPTVSAIVARDFPHVLFFSRSTDPRSYWVDADNFEGGRTAADYLLSLGHQRIAMIQGPSASSAANDRFQGFRSAIEATGNDLDPRYLLRETDPEAFSASLRGMMTMTSPPTAFFAWSDDEAIQCLDLLLSWGYRVPDQVSVIGFDSTENSIRSKPGLTSIAQPICEMASEATKILSERIRGESRGPKQVIFPTRLDVRGSTAPAPKGS